jgi:hypothetical protein
MQGFEADKGMLTLENVAGHSQNGNYSLALRYGALDETGTQVTTPVFIPDDAREMRGYELFASPTLYPGQTLRAVLKADPDNTDPVTCQLCLCVYQPDDDVQIVSGPETQLAPGETAELNWTPNDPNLQPIVRAGIQLSKAKSSGTVYLDWLDWDGCPDVILTCPGERPRRWFSRRPMWLRAWVNAVDSFDPWHRRTFDLIQNQGRGMVSQGTREWTDYAVSAQVYVYVAKAVGLAARVQGLQRYYAIMLYDDGKARLVKALDGETVLAVTDFAIEHEHSYDLKLEVEGTYLRGWINGQQVFDVEDMERPLEGGAVALICEDGRLGCDAVTVQPLAG